MTAQFLGTDLNEALRKTYWRRELHMHGHERNTMTPLLAEALRSEIRLALEADGKPFDTNVARNVYNLAMAARDMCVAAVGNVKEAIDQIKDVDGPMETLDQPGTPDTQMQASETFGARVIREVLAMLPMMNQQRKADDPKALVHALAEARKHNMTDVAEELEVKLFGRVLSDAAPPKMMPLPRPTKVTLSHPIEMNLGVAANADPPLCEACKKDPDPRGGAACYDCREIAHVANTTTATWLNGVGATP